MKILVVEDEKNISSFISRGLQEEGHQVTVAFDGKMALALAQEIEFELIVLDVILPQMNGWEVCQNLRQKLNQDVPIIMLTALTSTEHIIKGLDMGADDYLAKPFKMAELLARINALHRRHRGMTTSGPLLTFAGVQMNMETREVWREGQAIKLTAREFNLLECFMKNPNKVISRFQLLDWVWGVDFDTGTNVVDVYMNYLRNKLEKGFQKKLFHTIIGMGYILREDHEA